MGPRIFREHGRVRRGGDPGLHSQSREGRSEAGADEPLALITPPSGGSKLNGPHQRPLLPLRAVHILKPPAFPGGYLPAPIGLCFRRPAPDVGNRSSDCPDERLGQRPLRRSLRLLRAWRVRAGRRSRRRPWRNLPRARNSRVQGRRRRPASAPPVPRPFRRAFGCFAARESLSTSFSLYRSLFGSNSIVVTTTSTRCSEPSGLSARQTRAARTSG